MADLTTYFVQNIYYDIHKTGTWNGQPMFFVDLGCDDTGDQLTLKEIHDEIQRLLSLNKCNFQFPKVRLNSFCTCTQPDEALLRYLRRMGYITHLVCDGIEPIDLPHLHESITILYHTSCVMPQLTDMVENNPFLIEELRKQPSNIEFVFVLDNPESGTEKGEEWAYKIKQFDAVAFRRRWIRGASGSIVKETLLRKEEPPIRIDNLWWMIEYCLYYPSWNVCYTPIFMPTGNWDELTPPPYLL